MGRKKIIMGAAALITVMAVAFAVKVGQAAEADMFVLNKGELQSYLELRGKVDLDKKKKVYARVSGIVKKVYVQTGDRVEENTELLNLEQEDLELELKKSQAAYDAAKSTAEEVKNSIRSEQLSQAEAQVEQARLALEAAEQDNEFNQDKLNKMRELFKISGISQQELKDVELLAGSSRSTVKDMEQRVKIAQYNLELLKKGTSKESISAAEANAAQSELQVEDSLKGVDRARIYSNLKGTVLAKYVSEGDMVQPGTAVFELGDDTFAYISVSALSDDAVKIKQGQKALIYGDALKDQKIEGEVYYIAPKAEDSVSTLGVEQQRVEVRVCFDNNNIKLKPGYGVDVKIITDEKKEALYVPYKALFQVNGTDSVFVVNDNKLSLRTVKKGIENDDFIEIIEGLSEGDIVVVDPDSSLKPGVQVKKPRQMDRA